MKLLLNKHTWESHFSFATVWLGIGDYTKYVHIKSTTVYAPRRNWDLGLPPTPHPQASVPPPPCFWGEGNTRWRERGWESPNSDDCGTLYMYVLCG